MGLLKEGSPGPKFRGEVYPLKHLSFSKPFRQRTNINIAHLKTYCCLEYSGLGLGPVPGIGPELDLSEDWLKVHKIEIFFGFDFEICIISLLVMSKYKDFTKKFF
jgi:hypothetical protein